MCSDALLTSGDAITRAPLGAGTNRDRLSITLCPELAGGGARLFDDGPAGSHWSLAEATPASSGAICPLYNRKPPA